MGGPALGQDASAPVVEGRWVVQCLGGIRLLQLWWAPVLDHPTEPAPCTTYLSKIPTQDLRTVEQLPMELEPDPEMNYGMWPSLNTIRYHLEK